MDHKEYIIKQSELLKAISNPIRLCLIEKLCKYEKCNVSFFTNCMEVSQSNISQHLTKLKDLGILGNEKVGQTVNYFIKDEKIKKIIELIMENENE